MAGNFNGWNPAANNMQLIANNTSQYDTAFSTATNVQFKFAANGNWTNNWGNSNQSVFTPPLIRTGGSFGANIQANGPLSGLYRFTFNDQTLAYHSAVHRPHRRHQSACDGWMHHSWLTAPSNSASRTDGGELHGAGDNDLFAAVEQLDGSGLLDR